MNILFLDDRPQRLEWARKEYGASARLVSTAWDTITALSLIPHWDLVSLDHDLNLEVLMDSNRKDSGMEVVRYLCEYHIDIKRIIVHSANDVAVALMVKSLRDAGYEVEAKQASA